MSDVMKIAAQAGKVCSVITSQHCVNCGRFIITKEDIYLHRETHLMISH